MLIWFIAASAFIGAIIYFYRAVAPVCREVLSVRTSIEGYESGVRVLRDLSETLEAGVLPSVSQWARLNDLDARVRDAVVSSVQSLRDSGAPVVPTLKRFRSWCEKQAEMSRFAHARSFAGLMQAAVISALVPLSSIGLAFALDLTAEHGFAWFVISVLAFVWSSIGAIVILIQSDRAKWAGLSRRDRDAVADSLAFSEMLLAQLQAGLPGDLAWSRARELRLSQSIARSIDVIAPSVFSKPEREVRWVSAFLSAVQNSIAAAVMDGRPAVERIAGHIANFEGDFRFQVSKEIEALSVRALKPLYLFAFPSMLALIGSALALTVTREFSLF